MKKIVNIQVLLLCFFFAAVPPLFSAGEKAGKQPQWVVHRFQFWEISTPEGFGFEVRQSAGDYREWWRTWDVKVPSRPGAEAWITYTERIFAVIGKNLNADCGGKNLPVPGDGLDTEFDKTEVTPAIAGSHYGFPTRRFTIFSEKKDRGDKCMERNYAVEEAPEDDGTPKRIEVTYTYSASYRSDLVPLGAAPSVKKGGPNFQTYLQMLATLKPRNRKTEEGEKGASKNKYGTVQLIQ